MEIGYTLITGASSGVGRELAIYLSKTHRLILNGRNEEELWKTRDKCQVPPLIWVYDLSKSKDIEDDLAAWIKEKELIISSFVHCAGVMKMVPLRGITEETMAHVFAVNTISPALIVKTLMSRKVNSKQLKSVVFISSNVSNRGATAFSMYGASKAALDGLMRNLAVELAPDVRINSVLPGGMITEMTKDIFADKKRKAGIEKYYPLGIGQPEDIAPVVGFLLSEESKWITGQQVTVDGGRSIDITERSDEND